MLKEGGGGGAAALFWVEPFYRYLNEETLTSLKISGLSTYSTAIDIKHHLFILVTIIYMYDYNYGYNIHETL